MIEYHKNIVYIGTLRTIEYAVQANGKMPAKDFFYGLGTKEQRRLHALFMLFGDTGAIRNREKFKKVEGTDFFEFKRFNIRVMCFMEPGGKVILTHGFIKKKDKILPAEIQRAKRIRVEHQTHRKE